MDTLDLKVLRLYEDQYILNEGLIRTVDIKTTARLVHKFGNKNELLVHTEEDNFPGAGKNNGLQITLGSITEKVFLDFMKLMDNLGWFSSWIVSGAFKYSEKSALSCVRMYNMIELVFEAKFDLIVAPADKRIKNNSLYHVTPASHADKIKKIGLVPKSHSKVALHPERIYLAIKKEDALDMAKMFSRIKPNEDLILITIDTNNLPDYVKLYSDPNYFKKGVYTLNNIPPNAITDSQEL